MNPTSAQHAALRMLIDDIDPLLRQTAAIVDTLKTVQTELHADLETLDTLVRRSVDAQPALLETGRRLSHSAARIEATLQTAAIAADQGRRIKNAATQHGLACVVAALFSIGGLTGAAWIGTRELREQARIGRALQTVWPSIDSATRTRVHQELGRP